jgi:UDP-glucose 4-epimerase
VLKHLNDKPAYAARTVIIGAGGFVGKAIADRLNADGATVVALTRHEADLLAPDGAARLAAQLRPGDAVVAAAARAPCKDLPMFADNVTMMRAMLSALSGVALSHVVNISSDAVFADEPLPLTEDTPTAPGTYHGAMHLLREIAFATEIKAPLAILRPSLLYGAADPHNGYGPNRFRRLANAGEDIALFGEGEERRDHVLIDDLAELASRVLRHRSQGTLNVATGAVHSFRSVAEQVVAAAPGKVAITGRPRLGPMPHNGYRPFTIDACRAAFPDFVYTPLADGIAKVQRESVGAR